MVVNVTAVAYLSAVAIIPAISVELKNQNTLLYTIKIKLL
jgi:hypothetical protein